MRVNKKYNNGNYTEKEYTGRACMAHRSRHKNSRKSRAFRVFLTALMSAVLFTGSLAIFGSILSTPDEIQAKETEKTIFYKNITIETGDSLWSIAEEYKTNICESTDEYVQYLKELNHLKSSRIYYGDKLIVAYNADTIE
ncbi:MAG: LysM peptidoglycan-binding domain-containing protein [Schaedlerella sp.]|nr:LysM peptidoglycan-binding domain-containing protein [Lachnospiraceae bacterium]MDY4203263.1 LysM peptidoglycan-binding domain-containing protein [Schaedlerella sp.]